MQNKNILLAVTGGIAVYKACILASQLTQKGANVRVVMTESATKFVSPLTFQALSRNPVYTDTFDEKDPNKIAHIDVADWADIIVIAPATANVIGKIANGIADDMLTTTLIASRAITYIAPAMNVDMYKHPAVMSNMNKLVEWGYRFIEPGAGYLACGYVGKGRLEEPESIINVLVQDQRAPSLLSGKKVLISAGPTREKIDPVRFLTNRSTGKMGYALAEVAAQMGADVTLVSGPVNEVISHVNVKKIDIVTAKEMAEVMEENFSTSDIVIKAAAVADYRPKLIHDEKVKKQTGDWQIELERTKDILQSLGEKKEKQFLVGFAAETSNVIQNGLEKLTRKYLDAIVVNDITTEGAGFGGDTNIATYINKHEEQHQLSIASKREIAKSILKLIVKDMKGEQ